MATQIPNTLADYFDIVRRRWIYLATLMPAGLLIAVYLAFTLPTLYLSSATIMLEASSIPENLIRTTVTAYADQQLELVRRRVLTTQNLAKIVEELDPYPGQPNLSVNDKARLISDNTETERVDPITLEPLPESNAFSIHYLNPDARLATQVTSRLADMFLSYNREARTDAATETYRFLQTQSEQASKRLAEVDSRLAAFKSEHGDALPETQARNEQALDRARDDLAGLQERLLSANDRRHSLELQLSQINPNLFDPDGAWREELASLRAELAIAQQKYTPEHPDVRRLRRAIESLSARANKDGATAKPDNPEYIQVNNQLNTAKQEIAALQTRISRTQKQIADYEKSLQKAPEVEREYRQITREYDTAKQRYEEIQTRLSEADLGRVMESERLGSRLTLIQPPYTPRSPYSPNRLGIILLGIVLSGGLAVGLAALTESTDPTIRSARDLGEITDIKPLATVPFILNDTDRRKRWLAFGAASIILAIAVLFVGSTISQAV